MSGYKRATITIGQEEYDRLRDAEIRLRTLPEASSREFNQIIQQSNSAMQDSLKKMQHRQAALDQVISGMGDYIRDLETATSKRLMEYQSAAVVEAQQYAGNLWENVNRVLDQQAETYNQQIKTVHQNLQNELAQYARRVRKVMDDQDQKRSLAFDWLDAAEQFSLFIDQEYDHEMLAPGRFERLASQLDQARMNLEVGLSEAVIVTAQQLYSAFSDLRVELERTLSEWNVLLQTAWEAVSQLQAMAKASEQVQAVDLDGNELPFDIPVDYWSQGRLGQLLAELNAVRTDLEDQDQPPSREVLERWLSIDLQIYYQALEDIVLDARVNALNSQLRINIADLVVRALQDQGYALENSDYESADQRKTYDALLSNLDGSEVIVKVAPSGRDLGQNELHLQSIDREEHTEHELQQRWLEVSRSLTHYGLDVGQVVREDVPVYQANGRVKTPLKLSQQRGQAE